MEKSNIKIERYLKKNKNRSVEKEGNSNKKEEVK